ncbi:hypothetical protein BV898_03389 [Hypsibius exemplaris]|uniref:Uncharacterized protein n=1 Tax=Hypsibius exemplaris TaxID=2072580 RepID=A0A1W0X5G1_HYPEX|nr:hypothetical protein BV898_03389 [Hypsibius exemplaris]
MSISYSGGSRISLAPSYTGNLKPEAGERLWKPTVSGVEYTTTTYGLLKLLIMGMSVAGFVSLLITIDGHADNGRYSCFLASTALTFLTYLVVFGLNRLRYFDPRKPSLPHQIERLNGLIFAVWNFVSAGLVAPVPKAGQIPSVSHLEQVHCHEGIPDAVCRGSTITAAAIGFVLSVTITINLILAIWWGPPLRYSLRFKNLTEGEKYQNFANPPEEDLP